MVQTWLNSQKKWRTRILLAYKFVAKVRESSHQLGQKVYCHK